MVEQNIPFGITIGLVSYTSLYIGKGIQKFAIEGIKEKQSIKNKHSGVWIFGTVLTALPVFVQWAALVFAPVNLIAPLEGFGLLMLLIFSFFVLKEKINHIQAVGALCIIMGTVFVTLFAARTVVQPVAEFSIVPLIIIAGVLFTGEGAAILLSKKRDYRFGGPIIGFAAGTMMAFQTFTKRLSLLTDIRLLVTAAVFLFAVLTLVVTQFGFVKAKANEVVLAFTSASILVASLLGSVVLGESPAGIQYGGMAAIIIGVFLLMLFKREVPTTRTEEGLVQ